MEDYVTSEQAKKLKELGFDWECNHIYKKDFFNQWSFFHCLQDAYGNHNQGGKGEAITISAPTLAQAQKWLREKGKIILINVVPEIKQYYWNLYDESFHFRGACNENYNTYEEALSAGIDKALALLKQTDMEKKFKPFDKVLVRDHEEVWQPDFYCFWDKCRDRHQTMNDALVTDDDLLPYEGNEHLVGTTDKPDEEEVRLEEGEYCFFCDNVDQSAEIWIFDKFKSIRRKGFGLYSGLDSALAVRFSDFNPNDMEETRKHILCVKDGKIIRFKD